MNILIVTLMLIVQGGETVQIHHRNPEIESFKWLIDTWKNVEHGTFESWQFSDQLNSLIGKAYRITASPDTVITEQMQITCEQKICYFIADVPQNPQPIRFKIVKWDTHGFRSENPEHDFPTFVEYRVLYNKKLEVKIGDDNRTIEFKFERVE